jgi:hypothetical protein
LKLDADTLQLLQQLEKYLLIKKAFGMPSPMGPRLAVTITAAWLNRQSGI